MRDWWFQDASIDATWDWWQAGNTGNPIIALPTGTGKSHVIAKFIMRAMSMWPSTKSLCLTHVKELVEQNSNKLREAWPLAPMGINSAGLGRRDYYHQIIYAGIGSIKNNVRQLGHRDIVFIDECHLVSPNQETTYRKVLDELLAINPAMKVVGLTATYYRLGLGLLTEGGIFDKIVFDMTTVEGFNQLIAEGYLCPLIPKHTNVQLDVSGVSLSGGEFVAKELQEAVDKDDVSYKALTEMCHAGWDRRSWLIFASGVEHADKLAAILSGFGVPTASIHSKMTNAERDSRIAKYKAGEYRCLTNNNVLTTGFDHQPMDFIGMLRPTSSPSLWVQMAGRGTRVFEGKDNCLLMDFAGNTARLGPINDPRIPRKGKKTGEVPVRLCEECGAYNHASARICFACGFEFPVLSKLHHEASDAPLLASGVPTVETYTVDRAIYHRHTKIGAPPSMRVTYYCDGGFKVFKEWIPIESKKAFGQKKAKDWWLQRYTGHNDTPGRMPFDNVTEALDHTHELATPARLSVWVDKKPYAEIVGYEF